MGSKPRALNLDLDVDAALRDVEGLPLDVVGAWTKIFFRMHQASPRGTLTRSRTEWASALGVSPDAAETLLKHLLRKRNDKGVFDGEWKSNGEITLVNRRMVREEHSLLLLQERVTRFREKKRGESEGEWLEKVRDTYSHLDLDFQLAKMDRWLELPENVGRQKTRRFILNWLNREPRPVKGASTNGTLTAALAWAEVQEMRDGKRKAYSHPAIARTTKAIGGIFDRDITTTSLDVKRGQFLKMFPDIYAAMQKEAP